MLSFYEDSCWEEVGKRKSLVIQRVLRDKTCANFIYIDVFKALVVNNIAHTIFSVKYSKPELSIPNLCPQVGFD